MDVVGIGLANIDLVAHVKDDFLTQHKIAKGQARKMDDLSFARLRGELPSFEAIPGGGAANTMCGMAAYGVSTQFYGKIGEDSFESLFRASFREYGVAYDVAPGRRESSQCAVLVTPDGERSFAYIDGASWDLETDDIDPAVLEQAKMICMDSYAFKFGKNESVAKHVIQCAERKNIPMVMKVKEYEFIRPYAQKIKAMADGGVLSLLVGNHENLPFFEESKGIEATLEFLKSWKCDVLMTANTGGAYFISKGEITHHPAQVVANPKNTAGAGDQFLAGFLMGRLDNKTVTECMEFANTCARSILMHDTARPPLVNKHSIRF